MTNPEAVTRERSPPRGALADQRARRRPRSRAPAARSREILARRELLNLLVRRELKARYKDSALGFLWSLLRPLSQLLVYYVAIGKFLGARAVDPRLRDLHLHRADRVGAVHRDRQRRHRRRSSPTPGWSRRSTCRARSSRSHASARRCSTSSSRWSSSSPPPSSSGSVPTGSPAGSTCRCRCAVVLVFATALGAAALAAVNVYLRDVQYLVEIVPDDPLLGVARSSTPGACVPTASRRLPRWRALPGQPGDPGGARLPAGACGWPAPTSPFPDRPAACAWSSPSWSALVLLWLSQRVFARLQGNFAQEL